MFRDGFPLGVVAVSVELFVCFVTANRAAARVLNRDQAVACGAPALLFCLFMHRRGILCVVVVVVVGGSGQRQAFGSGSVFAGVRRQGTLGGTGSEKLIPNPREKGKGAGLRPNRFG